MGDVVQIRDFQRKKEKKIVPPGYEVPADFNLATALGLDRAPDAPPCDTEPAWPPSEWLYTED